ncbi:hypothetical protein JAAARDRAFT_127291 [Jaapia argillacea MUCL 33604]|uniref:Cerato-platanin n=1 Tax=Jaapia argillacea MUCL 33604 TaxID=933084 RepID=A0A067PYC7_9AGAM|nr:hypothetical protein JAAARDRAFT_127291 [Jaapia argillacea MUCL 33604]
MKFTLALATVTALLTPFAFAQTASVSYDTTYDNGAQSLATVACSNGVNGLMTKGYTTFASLPNFPYIGGAVAVTGWDSAACGTCWQLMYGSNMINVLAIDVALEGYNLSEEAMNALTGGLAVELGRVTATAVQVAASECGL